MTQPNDATECTLFGGRKEKNMKTNICTTQDQSARLLKCGVPAESADMSIDTDTDKLYLGAYSERIDKVHEVPAWSLSRLLSLLPFKIPCGNFEFLLNVAPIPIYYVKQWSFGYYCIEKPRTIKGLTHNESLIECAVQEIEWLSDNGYKLKGDSND